MNLYFQKPVFQKFHQGCFLPCFKPLCRVVMRIAAGSDFYAALRPSGILCTIGALHTRIRLRACKTDACLRRMRGVPGLGRYSVAE